MVLKIIIVILFIGLLISLTSALIFLFKDIQSPKKRTLFALGTRILLASLLLITVFYGLYTGQLGSHAPWDRKLTKDEVKQLQQ